jgi:8-oxo-dGTP pyrophosphatase MutT (NUDIX family)
MVKKSGCCIWYRDMETSVPYVLIVMGKNSGLWGFPKGDRKIGESVYSCAIREVFEETGIKVPYLGECMKLRSCLIYCVEVPYKMPVTIDKNEITDYAWVRVSDIGKYKCTWLIKSSFRIMKSLIC